MKKLVSVLVVASPLFATSLRPEVQPTMYECESKQGTKVGYTTTSFVGKPTFSVDFRGQDADLPSFPELKYQHTVLGNLITASDFRHSLVDGPILHYTLVLPKVILKDTVSQEVFDTLVIKTSESGGRRLPYGTFSHSSADEVKCVASYVVF